MRAEPSEYNSITYHEDWLCATCGISRGQHIAGVCPLSGSLRFVRRLFPFVAMLRIKNEERWIAEVLESIMPLVSMAFVMDDHSTDGTREICQRFDKIALFESPFIGMNESRDKNWLYDQIIRYCEPEWILCIDGDEVLERRGPEIIRETTANTTRNAFSLQIAFMWNSPDQVRTDRIYRDFWRPSLFRPYLEDPAVPDTRTMLSEFRFKVTPFGRRRGNDQPNLHCSSVPQRFLHGRGLCPARLKHYGYMTREARVRKLDFYTAIDWDNPAEDCYRHMCQGDGVTLDELPRALELASRGDVTLEHLRSLTNIAADRYLVHAGPLQIEPWTEETDWPISEWARAQHI